MVVPVGGGPRLYPTQGDEVITFIWLIRRFITGFERRYGYDAGYSHFMLRADPKGARLFMKAAATGQYDRGVPLALLAAARFVAVLAEDCGPLPGLA